jgi:DNA modification methylase
MKMNQARIIIGDNRATLQTLETGSVQTCITSPPYWGLRDYGEDEQLGMEKTPEEFVEQLCKVFDEVWRVLANDGTLWLNLGDSYYNNFGGGSSTMNTGNKTAIEQKGRNNLPKHDLFKIKDLIGIPWRVAFALQERGWYLRQDIIWAKPNPMPESVTDRCTKSHEYMFLLTKQPKYFYDHEAIKEPVVQEWGTRDRSGGKYHNEGSGLTPHTGLEKNYMTRNKRDVWTVTTSRFKGAHFATYPPELIEPCVLAGSREGDWVLDPFSGSGTTGVVALANGRNYVGCELNPDYAEISLNRIQGSVGMLGEVAVISDAIELEKATSES